MKNNTTLMSIVQSELINNGFNEFAGKNSIDFYNDEKQFIKKVMRYDNDVDKIVTRIVFQEVRLNKLEHDLNFKKVFMNRFLRKQINRQTVEDFSSQVLYTFFLYEDYLNSIYEDLDKFLKQTSESDTKMENNSITDDRMLSSDLPRDNINLNVDDTILNYGNVNTISRNKNQQEGENSGIQSKYNIDELLKIKALLAPVFNDFERNCFMQIF